MCMLCSDFVDECYECGFNVTYGDGTSCRKPRQFFLDQDEWCDHLTAKHGTRIPGHYRHFQYDHTGPDCECITGRWWPGLPEPTIDEDEDE